MWSEAFADAQDVRMAFENKERSGQVDTESFAATVALYKEAEERLRREMVACYRVTVPAAVRRWQETSAGIGDSTLARLLGATGDPGRPARAAGREPAANGAWSTVSRIPVRSVSCGVTAGTVP